MRRGNGRMSIYGKMKGPGLALALMAAPVSAAEYVCQDWDTPHQGQPRIKTLTIKPSLMIHRAINGFATTVRMTQSTLTRRIYPDAGSVWVVHGDFVSGEDGPDFGPRITLQRLVHDRNDPILATTTCETSDDSQRNLRKHGLRNGTGKRG